MVVGLFKVLPPEGATRLRLNFDILPQGLIGLVFTALLPRRLLPELQGTRFFFICDVTC